MADPPTALPVGPFGGAREHHAAGPAGCPGRGGSSQVLQVAEQDVAYEVELILDTKKNRPNVVSEDFVVWERAHGTRVEIPLRGRYIAGKQSVPEYLKATAIVKPHARIRYQPPDGEVVVFERATEELPPKTKRLSRLRRPQKRRQNLLKRRLHQQVT